MKYVLEDTIGERYNGFKMSLEWSTNRHLIVYLRCPSLNKAYLFYFYNFSFPKLKYKVKEKQEKQTNNYKTLMIQIESVQIKNNR